MITFPKAWIPYLNIAVIVFYLIFMIRGAKKGFLMQLVTLASTVLSFLGAWRYSAVVADHISIWPKSLLPSNLLLFKDAVAAWLNQAAWFVVLLIAFRLLFLILEKLVSGLQRVPILKEISRLLGSLIGALVATIWILVIAFVLHTPLFSNGAEMADGTAIGAISSSVSEISESLGLPVQSASAFNKLYSDVKSLDDSDQKALDKWLDAHGFEEEKENEPSVESEREGESE